jgi:MFS family permease
VSVAEKVRNVVRPAVAPSVHPRRLLVSALCGAVAFSSAMTIVSAVLSDIATDLHSSTSTLSWAVTGLFLTMAVSTPVMGRIGDAYGRRPVFLLGTAILAIAMTLCIFVPTALTFITIRALTGFGIACSMPNAIAMVINAHPAERRAQALGWYQGTIAGVPVFALILGAWMTERFGWRSVFLFLAPVAIVGFALGILNVHDVDARKTDLRVDWWGAATFGLATLVFLLSLERAKHSSFSDPWCLTLFFVAIIVLLVFVRVEKHAEQPLLRLDYFSRRNFTGPLLAQPTAQFAYMGGMVLTPLMLRHVFLLSTTAGSWLLLLRPAFYAISAPLAGRLERKVGVRFLIATGSIGVVASMAAFATAAATHTLGFAIAGLILSGMAIGIAVPGYSTAIAGAVDPQDLGIANGMSSTIMNIGTLTGIQTMFVVLGERRSSGAFTEVWITGAVVAAVGIVGSLIMQSNKSRRTVVVQHAA